jgi:hypothetical protein
MTFLRLNGWRLPISNSQPPTKGFTYNGELDPSFRNTPMRHRRSIERGFQMRTTKMEAFCATTLEGLLDGKNHHFPFVVDAWSESGLGPELGTSVTLVSTGGPIATRGHYVVCNPLVLNPFFIDDPVAPDGGRWTAIWWELVSGSWQRISLRSTGEVTINGVPQSFPGTVLANVTTGGGGIAFLNSVAIADLVLLSFYACDEFLADEYEWVSGRGAVRRLGFDRTIAEEMGGAPITVTGSPGFRRGPVGFGIDSAAGDLLNLGALPDAAVFGSPGGFSVRLWAQLDSIPGAFSRLVATLNAGSTAGWALDAVLGSGNYSLNFFVAGGVASNLASADLEFGTLYHLVIVYESGALTLYVDGQLATPSSNTTGNTPADDTANDLLLLNNAAIGADTDGLLDEVVIHTQALSATQVAEIYACEQKGQAFPVARFSSPMPALDIFGDFDRCRPPISVIGRLESVDYRQVGEDGWENNRRETAFALQQTKYQPGERRVPRPDMAFVMSQEFLDLPILSLQPLAFVSAPSVLGSRTSAETGLLGPFNWPDAAFSFGDPYRSTATINSQQLAGGRFATIAAWVRPDAVGSAQGLMSFGIGGGDPKLELILAAGGAPSVRVRAAVADGADSVAAATQALSGGQWAFVSATVDLLAAEAAFWVNGRAAGSGIALANLSQDTWTDEAGFFLIGETQAGSEPFVGRMAACYFWRHTLRPAEFRSIYDLGIRGVFA